MADARGRFFQLTNTRSTPVVVYGYVQDPYLRVGPGGVFGQAAAPIWWWLLTSSHWRSWPRWASAGVATAGRTPILAPCQAPLAAVGGTVVATRSEALTLQLLYVILS